MSVTASKPVKKKSTLIPLGDRVVVERDESEQKTSGGILLPGLCQGKSEVGVGRIEQGLDRPCPEHLL